MPRNTYSVASATFAESAHVRCSGAGGAGAVRARDGTPSARAAGAMSAAAASAAAARHAAFTIGQFIVETPPIPVATLVACDSLIAQPQMGCGAQGRKSLCRSGNGSLYINEY